MKGLAVDLQTGLPIFKRQVWCELGGTITNGTALVIDQLPLADFDSMTYEITFKGPGANDVKSFTMKVQNRTTEIRDTVYGRIGQMSINVDTNINGSNYELIATNNEGFDINYSLAVLTN